MSKNFLWLLIIFITINLSACQKANRDLYAIHIHGDWCKTCQKIDPVLEEMKGYFKSKGIDYLVFNETDPKALTEAYDEAAKYGLEELFENERHTGELLFVDKRTKKVLTRYYGIADKEKYIEATEKILNGEKVPNIERPKPSYQLSKPPLREILKAKLYLIDLHHDKCGGCSITTPVFEDLAEDYLKNDDISFFTFDLTNKESIEQSRKLAKGLGLLSLYNKQKHTGEVLFVDAKTKAIIGRLVTETDPAKYRSIIKKFQFKNRYRR